MKQPRERLSPFCKPSICRQRSCLSKNQMMTTVNIQVTRIERVQGPLRKRDLWNTSYYGGVVRIYLIGQLTSIISYLSKQFNLFCTYVYMQWQMYSVIYNYEVLFIKIIQISLTPKFKIIWYVMHVYCIIISYTPGGVSVAHQIEDTFAMTIKV